MDDSRLPKCVLYGELSSGKQSASRQYLRYKDSLKCCLNKCNISLTDWEEQATHRSAWRGMIHDGINHFEANRAAQAQVKEEFENWKTHRTKFRSSPSVPILPVHSAAVSVLHASDCSTTWKLTSPANVYHLDMSVRSSSSSMWQPTHT